MTETMTQNVRSRGRPKSTKSEENVQRYQLVLTSASYREIKDIADAEHSTVLETIRRLIRYGLTVYKILNDRDASLFIRKGDVDREVVLG